MASNRYGSQDPEIAQPPLHSGEYDAGVDGGHRVSGAAYDEYGSMADPYGPRAFASASSPAGPGPGGPAAATAVYGPLVERPDEGPADGWNPTEESVRAVRGRHRVSRQRNGGMARSGAVLGVGVIAAVGAGGMATAKDKSPTSISMPDLASAANKLPDAKELPGVGQLLDSGSDQEAALGEKPLTRAGLTDSDLAAGRTNATEAMRSRILAQADRQRDSADSQAREAAVRQASSRIAEQAAAHAESERKAAAEQQRKQEAAKRQQAEAERRAKLARSFTLPVGTYTLSEGFGASGGMWQSTHTGQDFASPTGTPVKAIHSGTVKEAGWAGSFGYRIVLELEDGTELWFCHLSSLTRQAGTQVHTGDVIGRVGSTGNSSGPHLHVEVHPGGGDAVDPLPWLRGKGLTV